MQRPPLNDADEELTQWLLAQRVLEPRQLEQALAARDQAWQRALRRFVGIWCGLSPGQLVVQDYLQGRELGVLTLDTVPDPDAAPATLFYQTPDGELERAVLVPADTGLLLNHDGCWLQTRDPLDTPWLGQAGCLQLFPGHDLLLSPRRDLLAVSERHAGRLLLAGLPRPELRATVQVREPGSHKAINLVMAPAGPLRGQIWLTDSESDRLGRLDPASGQLEWLATGLGRLGQLAISPEGDALYVLALTPLLRLVKLDLARLDVLGELDLPGVPASLTRGVPTDLLEYDAASGQLRVLVLQHGVDTPALLQVSPDLRLQGEPRPVPPVAGWAWLLPGVPNPVQKWAARRLDDWIAELEFLTAEHLARLRQQQRFGTRLDARPSAFEPPAAADAPLQVISREAPPITLPPEAVQVLVHQLQQAFFQENGQRLEGSDNEQQRLRDEAEQMRTTLESHYVALAELDQLLGRYSLQLLVTRADLLRSLDYHLGGKSLPFRPGHCCPLCQRGVHNPRHCPHCGFALDDPDWRARRQQQSAESCDELIPGQMVLALPHARRLVFLDAWLQVIQELGEWTSGRTLESWQEPLHVLALPDQHWLVCDAATAQVAEVTPGGELVAMLDHRFQRPVLASFRREGGELSELLVLDQGAGEVLAFSREGRLQRRWGSEEGLDLEAPTDFQWTWSETLLICEPERGRVSEWEPAIQQPVQHWDAAQQLQRPVLARRQLNGETVIVDAGLGEILCFGPEKALLRRFRYWPPPGFADTMSGQPAPDRMLVLPQGDLLCLGRKYWMQVQMTLGTIRWVQPWTGARRPAQQKKRLMERSQEPDSLKRLRQIQLLQDAESEALLALDEQLTPLQLEPETWALKAEDMNGTLFFLLEGTVAIRLPGQDEPVAILGAGDTFGEVALVLSEPFAAGFQALGPARLLQLKRSQFKTVVTRFADLTPQLRALAQTRKALLQQADQRQQRQMMDKVKAQLATKRLQELSLFAEAPPELLESLSQAMRPLAFMPAKAVFTQGESGDSLFFISRGQVGLYLDDSDSSFLDLRAGDVFGELAGRQPQTRGVTARTASYCQLYELERSAFQALLEQMPLLKDLLDSGARERQLLLQSEQMRLAERQPAPVDHARLPRLEVQTLQRVRPGLCFGLDAEREVLLCLNETGQLQWRSGKRERERLYRPTRLSVADELVWVADTDNDRVLGFARKDGRLVRELGPQLGLSRPRSAVQTLHQHLLIADEGNGRLLLVSLRGDLLWEYQDADWLTTPWYAEQTLKGTVLVCDRQLHQVLEIEPRTREVLWGTGAEGELREPSCVRRLSSGATLIADTGNHRLLLLSPVGTLMRTFTGNARLSLYRPLHVELLDSGEMLVYPEQEARVLRLGMAGQPVWQAELQLPDAYSA
ncbi:MAG: cyclic nucleotide-binding domain-containing protein [Candidatus Sericytochromatia bacterium]